MSTAKIIAQLVEAGHDDLAEQLVVATATNTVARLRGNHPAHQQAVAAWPPKLAKTYTKLPGKVDTDLFTNGTLSDWEGYLADVFFPFEGKYNAHDFIPEALTRVYTVYFVVDERGKPVKLSDSIGGGAGRAFDLVGETFSTGSGNRFFGTRTKFGTGGRGFEGKFAPTPKMYGLKIKLGDLNEGEVHEYAKYLDGLGYIDASDAKVSKALWTKFLKAKTFDELYDMDPKIQGANEATKLISWVFKSDDDAVLKKLKGVYSIGKNKRLKFAVPMPK